MSSQVELVPPAVDHLPPVRHIFEGYGPPEVGDAAICGVAPDWPKSTGDRRVHQARRDHCVVCVELARARGYRL